MTHQARRIPTPWESRKRKERDNLLISKPSSPTGSSSANEPGSSNRLLAGYMAHEFLSKGTLFGQKFDPARAEAVPVKLAGSRKPSLKGKPDREVYAEVASLLKNDGAHVPEIVNPSQLACWIRM